MAFPLRLIPDPVRTAVVSSTTLTADIRVTDPESGRVHTCRWQHLRKGIVTHIGDIIDNVFVEGKRTCPFALNVKVSSKARQAAFNHFEPPPLNLLMFDHHRRQKTERDQATSLGGPRCVHCGAFVTNEVTTCPGCEKYPFHRAS